MSFPKSIPKRSPDKSVIIDLGEVKRLKVDCSRMTEKRNNQSEVKRSKIVLAGNETERKRPRIPALNLDGSVVSSSSRNIHRLEMSPQPRILKTSTDRENIPSRSKSKQLSISKRNIDVSILPENRSGTKILTEMVEDLLNSKKGVTTSQTSGSRLKRLVNRNVRKTQENIPYWNLVDGVRHWDYYEGQTLDNLMHGYGRLSYINGQSFAGSFIKGVASDGKAVIGIWKAGQLAKRLA